MGDGLGERMAESGSRLSIEFNLARGGLGKYGDCGRFAVCKMFCPHERVGDRYHRISHSLACWDGFGGNAMRLSPWLHRASDLTAPRAEQTLHLFAFKSAKQERSGWDCRACVPTNIRAAYIP